MNEKRLCLIGLLSTLVSGCAMVTRSPVTGFVYNDTQAGEVVASNQAGTRVGESCATSILGLVATGDASIEGARRNGGITLITTVDNTAKSFLGIYAKYCTVVRGR